MGELLDSIRQSGPLKVLISIAVITVAGAFVFWQVERMLRQRTKRDDAERVIHRARRLRCSEYDIFLNAARRWNISEDRVADDFKRYLHYGEVPHYVRHHVRDENGHMADEG